MFRGVCQPASGEFGVGGFYIKLRYFQVGSLVTWLGESVNMPWARLPVPPRLLPLTPPTQVARRLGAVTSATPVELLQVEETDLGTQFGSLRLSGAIYRYLLFSYQRQKLIHREPRATVVNNTMAVRTKHQQVFDAGI